MPPRLLGSYQPLLSSSYEQAVLDSSCDTLQCLVIPSLYLAVLAVGMSECFNASRVVAAT